MVVGLNLNQATLDGSEQWPSRRIGVDLRRRVKFAVARSCALIAPTLAISVSWFT